MFAFNVPNSLELITHIFFYFSKQGQNLKKRSLLQIFVGALTLCLLVSSVIMFANSLDPERIFRKR